MILDEDKGIHDGHRARMREKLEKHGARIFDTYELLEMLLYHVIPYRDTNPVAKRLLSAFGSLEGVLSATKDELMRVNGIGERAAELIVTAGEMLYEGELARSNRAERVFDNYCDTGATLATYFDENDSLTVTALMLDSAMRLLTTVDIYDTSFGSAALRPKPFIDAAMHSGATIAIIASKHEHGALYPTESDHATLKMITESLGAVGVRVAEHYIISGSAYLGVADKGIVKLSTDTEALGRFLESRRRGVI